MAPSVSSKLKGWVKHVSTRTGALRLVSQFAPIGAAILMYHSVQDEPERYANSIGAGIIHSASAFQQQMELVARNFSPVTVEDICSFLEGHGQLPRRAVAITFDDGYADNYDIALPILRRVGIPASFYLTVNFIGAKTLPWFGRLRYAFDKTQKDEWRTPANGKSWSTTTVSGRNAALLAAFDLCSSLASGDLTLMVEAIERDLDVEPLVRQEPFMMSWSQAKALPREGHLVGSHTLTHPNVAQLSDELARTELLESKRRLEEELGSPVGHFSYPHPALNPHWTAGTVKVTEAGGYRSAVTTSFGLVRKGDNPLALTRTWTPFNVPEFLWHLERTFLRPNVAKGARKKPAA